MKQRRIVVSPGVLVLSGFTLIAMLVCGTPVLAAVNVNIAGAGELEGLPGISKAVAERIIEYRNNNGPFSSLEQLTAIEGIGPRTLAKIKDLVVFDIDPTPTNPGDSGKSEQPPQPSAEEILAKYNHEPTIYEVQKAAVKQAHIHPEDIKRWRSRVTLQALVPQTKVRVDYYTRENSTYRVSQNIDFRPEPDRYVVGPDEYSIYNYDYEYIKYQLALSWDFDELVYNREELRVRKESEDLIDFMTKVVESVTKLYFERRRLQVTMDLRPDSDPRMVIEKQLRLEELTSLLDQATGGFFLEQLNKAKENR